MMQSIKVLTFVPAAYGDLINFSLPNRKRKFDQWVDLSFWEKCKIS